MTAPYISAQPTFKCMALRPGDIVLLASDGIIDTQQLTGLSLDEKAELLITVAGAAVGVASTVDLSRWEQKIGHNFLPRSLQDSNAAVRLVENVLHGADDVLLAREATIEVPCGRWQDDITVLLAEI